MGALTRDLKPTDDGRTITCKIVEDFCEGIITFEDGEYYICQNRKNGAECYDKKGQAFSWSVDYGTLSHIVHNNVTEINFTDEPEDPTPIMSCGADVKPGRVKPMLACIHVI